MRRLILITCLALAALTAGISHAQLRTIPPAAQRAQVSPQAHPFVTVNGQTMRLAPGVKIYNQNNMIIVSGSLPENSLVKFITDGNGDIIKVWILTPDEAAQGN